MREKNKGKSSDLSAYMAALSPGKATATKEFGDKGQASAWASKKGYSLNPGDGLYMVGQVGYQTNSPSSGNTRHVVPVYGRATPAAAAAPAQEQPPAAGQQAVPDEMKAWNDSIDSGVQQMIDPITKMINDNQANINLFMGTIGDLVKQMGSAQKFQQSSPYAVTTSTGSTAPTAQTTQPIARRPRPSASSLTIGPNETQSAGSGLNIAI